MSTATAPAKTSPAQAQAGRAARGRHGKLRLHNPATPYLLCLPYLLLLVTFVLVPAVFGIWISLHDWDFMLPQKPFIGLQNYQDLFDPTSVTYRAVLEEHAGHGHLRGGQRAVPGRASPAASRCCSTGTFRVEPSSGR